MRNKVKKENISSHKISITLNGKKVFCEVKSSTILIDLIRNEFGLKGTKPGCNEGECGACTVLVDGAPINSCLFLAVNAMGKNITTVEGLIKEDGMLDEVQQSLVQHGAVQCGFCTSGMAIGIKAMQNAQQLQEKRFSREEIKKLLEGNLCRCTGYIKIIDAAEKLLSTIE